MDTGTPRQKVLRRWSDLESERSSWLTHWQDLARYIKPKSYRYLSTDRNRGERMDQYIINGTATKALRIMAAGMVQGMSSPSRRWFKLGLRDTERTRFGPVRSYLDQVENILFSILGGSNVYKALHTVYEHLGLFSTAAVMLDDDVKDVVRAYVYPVGQYALGNSARLSVDTVYRRFSMTVGQLVQTFGQEACSPAVQALFDRGALDGWISVLHALEPNVDFTPGKLGARGKRYVSRWLELDGCPPEHGFLREAGYEECPVMAPRWHVEGEDIYGSDGPGMLALGDVRALQELERMKGGLVQKLGDPPMGAPSSMRNLPKSLVPGAVNYFDAVNPQNVFKPLYQVEAAAVQAVEGSVREHAQRINEDFFADLWMVIVQGQEDPRKTATEVAALQEEKMEQLGPVLENLDKELFGPLIDRLINICQRRGLFPKPPPEAQGQEIVPEYVSIMAQAQKARGLSAMERLAGFTGNIAAEHKEVLDKVNFDALLEHVADDLGVPADIIVAQEQVDAIRAQRAQAMAQQAAVEQSAQAAQAAQVLSQADTTGDNGLTRLISNMSPVAGGGGA